MQTTTVSRIIPTGAPKIEYPLNSGGMTKANSKDVTSRTPIAIANAVSTIRNGFRGRL